MRRLGLGLVLALAVCGVARGQVFEVAAGASTAFEAQGGTVRIHGENSDTTLGAGLSEGRFAAGGQSVRRWGGGLLTAGQQQVRVDVPTDIFEGAHVFSGLGLGYRGYGVAGVGVEGDAKSAGAGLNLFVGTGSPDGGTPLFGSSGVHGAAAVAQVKGALAEDCGVMTTLMLTGTIAALESVECTASPGLVVAGTAGFGGGAAYAAGSGRLETRTLKLRAAFISAGEGFARSSGTAEVLPEPAGLNASGTWRVSRGWSLNAAHEGFLVAGVSGALRSSVDEAGGGYQRRNVGFGVSVLHSHYGGEEGVGANEGVAGSLERQMGAMRVSQEVFASRSGLAGGAYGGWSVLGISTVSARVNAHVRVTEAANVSGSGVTFSHGGELLTGFSSFRVDYEMFYEPAAAGRPFEQAMVFSADVRLLRRLTVEASSSVDPLGRTVYTFSLGTEFVRHGVAGEGRLRSGVSGYTVRGRVVDGGGAPVEGAALTIGKEHLYSDSGGYFEFRESRAAEHALTVLPGEFLQAGEFRVVAAPATVRSAAAGVEVRVVVVRVGARRKL